jgi:Cu-Zn family superoxide dismutase
VLEVRRRPEEDFRSPSHALAGDKVSYRIGRGADAVAGTAGLRDVPHTEDSMQKSKWLLMAAVLAVGTPGLEAQESEGAKEKTRMVGAESGTVEMQAHAVIKGKGVSGTAAFTELTQGTTRRVVVTVSVKGLTPGLHGVHLHAVGKCEPDFTAAGGHFDPGPAGNTDPDANHPFHMGDLPNLSVGQDGSGTLRATTTRVTLTDGALSVFDEDGTAIILHGNEDKGITGAPKSGVSGGPRVACGVLEKGGAKPGM